MAIAEQTKRIVKRKGIEVRQIDVGFSSKFMPFHTTHCPIKAIHGGRSSGKTTQVAMHLVLAGKEYPERIICCREFKINQESSQHKALVGAIHMLGLSDFYTITDEWIRGKPIPPDAFPGYPIRQTEFIFMGIGKNTQNVKGLERPTSCWIDEAQNLSAKAWRDLEPTIRQSLPNGRDPEIWLTWNPQYADEFAYENFVLHQQPDSMVLELNYMDNPWLPRRNKKQAENQKAKDLHEYEHIWLGKPRQNFVGSVYEDYLQDAYDQKRINDQVAYDPAYRVELYFDPGYQDMCCIWAAQRTDDGIKFIDYYENSRKHASHYIEIMKNRGYHVSKWVLPHDGRQHTATGTDSWEDVFRKAGLSVRMLPKPKAVMDGINAAREQFSKMHFNSDKCAVGINALRHYRFAMVKEGQEVRSKPVHDVHSNGADAFRYAAIGFKTRERKDYPRYVDNASSWIRNGDSWMAV